MHRRTFWRWIAITALATVAAAALPTTASAATTVAADRAVVCPAIYPRPAYCDGPVAPQPAVASLGHIGWTYLNLNHCPTGMMCAAIFRESMGAWSWNGRAWSQTSLRQGWVYVYPYTGSWRWAWTQSTGWVAVTGGRFELRAF